MSASDKKKFRKEQESAALTEKQQAQQKEDKQLKRQTLTFVVIMVLIAAIAVTSLGFNWFNNSGIPARSTVAVTIGGTELSNADLNYYYIDTVNNFYSEMYSQYSTYTSLYVQMYYGLDMTKPLDAQVYDEETGDTWADYFLDSAIEYAKATYALYNAAKADTSFELPAEYQTEINNALVYTEAQAGYYGFDSTESYLKSLYGNGADNESYVEYYTINATADAYYEAHHDSLTYTADQIAAYDAEHFNDFSAFTYSYFYVNASKYLPEKKAESAEGSTEPTTAVEYTDEERKAAAEAAKADADKLGAVKTLDELNALITELTWTAEGADAEEAKNYPYSSVATLYNEWIADAARVEGDTTVVEYESTSDKDEIVDGYYVVLFHSRNDFNTENMRSVRHILSKFEGGTTKDGVTTYSDEEKVAAYEAAKATYDAFLAGEKQDEESFAKLVTTKTSDDGGSNTNGGLYENIYRGQMVEAFDEWVFDAKRMPGQHEIIETEIGYHIMFYVGEQDQTYREFLVEATLRNKDVGEWYEKLLETVTVVEGNTSHINRNLVIASSSY